MLRSEVFGAGNPVYGSGTPQYSIMLSIVADCALRSRPRLMKWVTTMGFLAQRKSDKALARGEAAFASGDIRSAVAGAIESLGLLRGAGVNDGSLVCRPMNLLFFCYRDSGDMENARLWGGRAISAASGTSMMLHGNFPIIAEWLATEDYRTGDFAAAAQWSERLFAHRVETDGPLSESAAMAAYNIGVSELWAEEYRRATGWLTIAYKTASAASGGHPSDVQSKAGHQYARAMTGLGEDGAQALLRLVLETATEQAPRG